MLAKLSIPAEQRFWLGSVSWETYEKFLDARGERRLRITYDRGSLEIMTTSFEHEGYSELTNLLILVLADEADKDIVCAGSSTFKHKDLERGLEPDKCYYLDHLQEIQGKKRLDLDIDPPPDLAIEIDISRSCLDRMGIYAAFKIPEVWRFDGEKAEVYRLHRKGHYQRVSRSRYFPSLPMPKLAEFLLLRQSQTDLHIVRAFRKWVRAHFAHQRNGKS